MTDTWVLGMERGSSAGAGRAELPALLSSSRAHCGRDLVFIPKEKKLKLKEVRDSSRVTALEGTCHKVCGFQIQPLPLLAGVFAFTSQPGSDTVSRVILMMTVFGIAMETHLRGAGL